MALTPSCALIAARVALGEWADLRKFDATDRTVTATFIRQLLLGLPIAKAEHENIRQQQPEYEFFVPSGDSAPVPVGPAGVRIRGAIVKGILDLADCGGSGGVGLQALVLEDCRLLGESEPSGSVADVDYLLSLDLSRSRITRLSLKGSRFGYVRAEETVIERGVDISGVQPLTGWIRRPWPGADMAAFRESMLAGTDFEEVSAAHPDDKLATDSFCWVNLTASQIGDEVIAVDAKLRTPPERVEDSYHPVDTRYCLGLDRAEVGGSLSAYGESVFDGGLNLALVEMRGEVWLGGARLIRGEGSALEAQGATLGGLFASGKPFSTFGGIYLNSARIKGHVNLTGASLDGDGGSSLHAAGSAIGGDLRLRSDASRDMYFAANGPIRLNGSTIGGKLEMDGALLDGRRYQAQDGSYRESEALDASFVSIGSSALLCDVKAKGCIWLNGADIGDALDMNGAHLRGSIPEPHLRGSVSKQSVATSIAVSGTHLTVGDSVWLGRGFKSVDGVRFQRARIEKDVGIVDATIHATDLDADAVDLGWTTISGTLIFENNDLLGRVRLTHADVNILRDYNHGYPDPSEKNLELGGFRYQSLHSCDLSVDDEVPVGCKNSRILWLNRMREYQPQPYAHLARVLGSQGQSGDAREILIAKHDEELELRRKKIRDFGLLTAVPRTLVYFASRLFRVMFGYGLKPMKAVATIVLAILLGSSVIFVANQRGAMVVDQQAIAGSVDGVRMGATRTSAGVADNVRCADSIRSVYYALDVFIPLVDLRQESKCEIGEAAGETRLFQGINVFDHYTFGSEVEIYRFFKAIYALAGWLIISLAILTFSGVLQRRDEK